MPKLTIDKTAALCELSQCSIAELDLAVRESMAQSGEDAENMLSE